jgi:hypothetical protein
MLETGGCLNLCDMDPPFKDTSKSIAKPPPAHSSCVAMTFCSIDCIQGPGQGEGGPVRRSGTSLCLILKIYNSFLNTHVSFYVKSIEKFKGFKNG